MSEASVCANTRMLFALLLYGELSFDEEENVDAHLDGCAACRAALEREKTLHAAFDGVAVEPAASLLRECGVELAAVVRVEQTREEPRAVVPVPAASRSGWWNRLAGMLTGVSVMRPLGAVALVALGFLGARVMP